VLHQQLLQPQPLALPQLLLPSCLQQPLPPPCQHLLHLLLPSCQHLLLLLLRCLHLLLLRLPSCLHLQLLLHLLLALRRCHYHPHCAHQALVCGTASPAQQSSAPDDLPSGFLQALQRQPSSCSLP
jgi:hypothetical protein